METSNRALNLIEQMKAEVERLWSQWVSSSEGAAKNMVHELYMRAYRRYQIQLMILKDR